MQTLVNNISSPRFFPVSRLMAFEPIKEALNRAAVSTSEVTTSEVHPPSEARTINSGAENSGHCGGGSGDAGDNDFEDICPPPWAGQRASYDAAYGRFRGGFLPPPMPYMDSKTPVYSYQYYPAAPRLMSHVDQTALMPQVTEPHEMYPLAAAGRNFSLPPFVCCEASLWRGRSEGMLIAGQAAKAASTGVQPIVIHNESSTCLQNETARPPDPPRVQPQASWLSQGVTIILKSPLNTVAVGSLTLVGIYYVFNFIQARNAIQRRRRAYQRMMLDTTSQTPSPSAMLLQHLFSRKRLLNPAFFRHTPNDDLF
eukprot:Blabericola_migrator_1__4728@NODE_2494_length_2681_cov_268_411247_g1564_i0_p2_GENE_NODE_2494_length_2681_cov_268_411247_g1564_i0NODE_2494_length_2681_cov_268_411247_g1564_i0_p2_ORF_typecomplete_len312_score32_42_NODE_2494_length_2681_cov_268_411247_g1564_i0931028